MSILRIIEKFKNNKSLINGSLFSLFSFINRGFGFLILLILATYITPTEYGYLSLFSTVTMVISYFIAMSTEGYISIAYFQEGLNGLKNTISGIFLTTIVCLCVFLLSLFLLGNVISQILELHIFVILLGVFICFFTVYTNILLDYYRIERKIKQYGLLSCGNAFLNFILSIVLVKYLLLGWEGRVYANMICSFIFGLLAIILFIKKKMLTTPSLSHLKVIILWGLPIIPHLATTFIRQGCDRYIINYYHTIEDVGLFSFALTLANIVMMVGAGFNQSNSVDIFDTLSNKDCDIDAKLTQLKKQKKEIMTIYFCVLFLIMIGGFFSIPLIMPQYSGAMIYFLILAVYGFIYCIYFLYSNYLFYFKRTKLLMYITFVSSISHLLLSVVLTRYSLYFTCLLYCVVQLAIVVAVREVANKEINKYLQNG